MAYKQLTFASVTFKHDGAPEPLFVDITLHLAEGWTGVVGANGSGKSTFLQLATGGLMPGQGAVRRPVRTVYCSQRTDHPPLLLHEFINDERQTSRKWKGKLDIADDYLSRWPSLSHGERKRTQIAVALWQEPELLAIDEPTNHLDSRARTLIMDALFLYEGIGLLVSHDREMLDRLCQTCLFIHPPHVLHRPGGFTTALAVVEQEKTAQQRQRDMNKNVLKKLQQEVVRRREKAQQADKKRSKRHLDRHDRDGRARKDLARVSGKDGQAGQLQSQLQGRLDQLQERVDSIRIEKSHTLGIWLPGTGSQRDYLLKLTEAVLNLGGEKRLVLPDLLIKPTDRIAITGLNGTGKSTLVRHLLGHLKTEPDQVTYIPQEIGLDESKDILGRAQRLPKEKLGHVMTIVSRLNSRPERLLNSSEPSPGEVRKLLLALGMALLPHIIILDEPTNHLDLQSIQCLEAALADCPCALVLVSHDNYFLRRLTTINWHLQADESTSAIGLLVRPAVF
jgi:ATPase subunit of ABC transporter with duplicated ATPase domains